MKFPKVPISVYPGFKPPSRLGYAPLSQVTHGYGVRHAKVVEGPGLHGDPCVANVAMGTEIDNVVEFEELAASRQDAPTAIVAMLD